MPQRPSRQRLSSNADCNGKALSSGEHDIPVAMTTLKEQILFLCILSGHMSVVRLRGLILKSICASKKILWLPSFSFCNLH